MRILEVVHGFPPDAQGGTELYAEAHARALQERFGDDVLVLTRESDRTRPEYDVRIGQRGPLRVVWVNNTFSTRTFAETYRNEAIGKIVDRAIDEFRPEAAHIHHLTGLSTTIVRSLAARAVPSVLTLHDYWLMCHRGQLLDLDLKICPGPEHPDGRSCDRCLGAAGGAGAVGFAGAAAVRTLEQRLPAAPARTLRRVAEGVASAAFSGETGGEMRKRIDHMREVCRNVTHFLAPSRYIRDRFVEFGIDAERISVSAYGIPAMTNSPLVLRQVHPERAPSPEPRPLRLAFLGSLMVSKGAHVLLEAIRSLPPHSVSIDIYGAYTPYHMDDSYRAQLEPLLRHDDVTVQGAVPHEEVAGILRGLDALVVPSVWPENSPFVIHEAFAAGVPVVASSIGGIPELVADERSGLLFRAGDPADLARVLTRLRTEPGLLDRLRAGIPPVRTLEDDVEQTRALYQRHLSTTPRIDRRPRVAAIVLNHRTPDDTFLAVKSLLAARPSIDEVIVVDNDGTSSPEPRAPSPEPLASVLRPVLSRIALLQTETNLGFSGGMNVGIRAALERGADRVLLVNSDVIVPPDCVERLEQALRMTPGAGIAGPVVHVRSEPDRIESLGIDYSPATGRMWHRGYGGLVADTDIPPVRIVDGVSGCVMLITRDVFEKTGLLDEDYFFGFEDLDFCLKARRAGFTTIVAGAAAVYHEGARSIGATSPRRLYFGARNHLLMASRANGGGAPALLRTLSIVTLNLLYACRSRGAPLHTRIGAVLRGSRAYLTGRVGPDA